MKYKKKHPSGGNISNYFNLEFNHSYKYNEKIIDIQNVIRKYDDYYFIFVDIADKSIYNAQFAQYDNHKDFFDSFSKYRYVEGNTLYSCTAFLPEGCYPMKGTYIIINEMKEKGYKDFYESYDYKLLDSYAYDPRYIYEKSVRYK
ncbi:MAG: hypothetical protein LBH43_18845 [Treponema sp.]|jgi:hypothetical protein|nr:hypothetical protein [Treponema sp.]